MDAIAKPPAGRSRLSLRGRLLIAFVAMLVPFVALLAYELYADYERRVDTIRAGQIETAGAVAALTDAVFDEGLTVARAIAGEPELLSGDPAEVDSYLRGRQAVFGEYASITLVDVSGEVVASSVQAESERAGGREPGPSIADRPYFKRLIATGGETVSNVVEGHISGLPVVAFAAPVRDSSRVLRGALVVTLALARLPDRLSHVQTSPGQVILLADPTSRVAFVTGATFGNWAQRDFSALAPIQRALAGEVVTDGHYVSPVFRDRRLAAFVATPDHGWVVGVTRNRDLALASVTAGVWRDVLATIALVLVAVFIGVALSRRLLSPIQRLTRQATALGSGLGRPSGAGDGVVESDDAEGRDELAVLTTAFARMATEVRERVDEVEGANARLAALMEAATTLVMQTSAADVADAAVASGQRIIEADIAGIWVLDEPSGSLRLLGSRGLPEGVGRLGVIPRSSDLAVARAVEQRRVIAFSAEADGGPTSLLGDEGIRYLIAAPLPVRRDLVGVVAFGRREGGAFDAADCQATEALAGMLAVALDRARLFEDLQHALRVREAFLNLAAHELRTPLTTLRGYVQLLERRGDHNDEVRRLLRALSSQSNRLRQLVDTLIDVSQIQSGKLVVYRRPVGLGQLAVSVAGELERTSPSHSIEVRCDQEVLVSADRARIRGVIYSLLDNALKYSPQGGSVEVTIAETPDEAVFSVRDEGIGISRETQAELFQAFYQEAPMVRPTTGMGLGLYISREIIRLHGGRIWFESEKGEGSTFHFALPRRTDGRLAAAAPAAAEEAPATVSGASTE